MLSRTTEDYLEAILGLIEEKGEVRIKDVAETLNVRPPSVTEMMQRMTEETLVNHERYGTISLTAKGEKIAKQVRERHEILVKLLRTIQIPEEVAEKDACVIEHELNPKTVEQLRKFVGFVENAPVYPKWIRHFKEYCETGEYPPECRAKQRKASPRRFLG